MKLTFAKKLVATVAAGVFSVGVFAQEQKAATLEELLNMVKQDSLVESREHKARESEFRQDKNRQAQLLEEAKAVKANEEKRSETLEAKYDEQEIAVQDKREQLAERLGSLKELFGHLTSTAGDLRSNLDVSIVSAQYPGRTEFLEGLIEKMNSATKLPSIEEIERLWFEMQRETIEGGKIVKFPATVVSPEGEQNTQEVVRIGTFNLLSDGKYLEYTESKKMAELTRQPSGNFLAAASALASSTDGFTKTGIDPTGPSGGSFLSALINSPDLVERWHQGGVVGYIITAVGAFGLLLGIFRLIVLTTVGAKVNSQLKSSTANDNNPLGRVLKVAEGNPSLDTESLELKMEEAVLKEKPSIEAGLNLIKIISAVAPLLGLLGTVTGMILTFQAITIFGAGDPQAMAGGISSALVTTVLGLVVAIPMVLMHTFVNSRAKRILHILDEQSAGIVAENAERS
ncbi:MotA/TolQ/ExbB proton channel family protein [Halioxenophilus aromaticivorans]|uniref:MotA/TolQ/ExbB proton channel family protein n=1 Tax=Halioxenophilus aromaticivorans TaxID=1306992 RepID=A0AAV3U281_9ALTE